MRHTKPNPEALRVARPKCGRAKGLLCATRLYSGGPWEGYSLKVHTERKKAAQAAKKGVGQ